MDFHSLTQDPFGSWILVILLMILIRNMGDIVWVIAVSRMAKSLSKEGYDVAIDKKGVTLKKSKPSCSRKPTKPKNPKK